MAALYFHRQDLCAGIGGKLIARHIGHDWVLDGDKYLRIDCAARVQVLFLDDRNQPGVKFGPYLHFSTMDGIAFGNHEVLAHIDARSQRWFVLPDGSEWPAVLVTPAG